MLRFAVCTLLALLPVVANAEVYVCQESAVSGLTWKDKAWRSTTYKGETFTLSRLPSDDPEVVLCGELEPETTNTAAGDTFRNYGACYRFAVMGRPYTLMNCAVLERNELTIRVMCQTIDGNITLVPNGEMIRSVHQGAPLPEIPEGPRASIYIAAGMCNKVQ